MGNTVIWKPSPTQQLAASLTMQLLEEAGLPPGVINMVPGDGVDVSDVVLAHPDLAGIHFTGSTPMFQHLWRTVGENIAGYRSYPRIVGETGGKDFIVAHPSADPDVLRMAMVRGAFEYQGQKCSAASRAYVPRSVWEQLEDELVAETEALTMGDVSDFSNFLGAVIDDRRSTSTAAIARAKRDQQLDVLAGGKPDDSVGLLRAADDRASPPTRRTRCSSTEYFGPCSPSTSTTTPTSRRSWRQWSRRAVRAHRLDLRPGPAGVAWAREALRFAAGNLYINDKPTGAVVGQQPFGGARASGTNDKAGTPATCCAGRQPAAIKETLVPPTDSLPAHGVTLSGTSGRPG